MMKVYKIKSLLCVAVTMAVLSGCSTTDSVPQAKIQAENTKLDKILEKAASHAYAKGDKKESLALMERAYKRDSTNPEKAVKYAKILRESGQGKQAAIILSPFIYDKNVSGEVLTEYAYIQTSLGNYNISEDVAMKALDIDENNYRARHALGIALDAKGNHKQAEKEFRKAMDIWEGDPIPLLNNLALCLASQGYLDDSVNLLRRAFEVAPNRVEIERNLRIITTLQDSTIRKYAPKPIKKPRVRTH